jgi:crotonobetainyl-CoA:carnitine CoA-transferase CaiB-like acyl-CoA transferase
MTDQKAFSGVRVFDATQGVAGPHCTLLLAQHGADVVKLEPNDGDWGRTLGKVYDDFCAAFLAFNRGKRSVALDLKSDAGIKAAQKLAFEADVVVESFRPDVMARFGLGYEEVKKHNPSVVYLSVTGFGQQGPNRDLPVTDSVIQAYSGWMTIHRDENGTPMRSGMIAVDVMTGLYAFQAISAALMRKFRFGEGSYIDCSLMQSAAAFQSYKILEHHLEGGAPQVLYVPVGTMKTADGFINITAMRDRHYVSLCEVLDLEHLIDDERFNTRDKRVAREKELMPIIRAEFTKKTTAEWAELLTEAGVMNAPVSTYSDFLEAEHVKAVGAVATVNHQDMPPLPLANIPGLPPIENGNGLAESPHIGQHTRDILREAGYADSDIDAMIEAGSAVAR